ncbi:peptidase domain-containing ABC transporter [Xanthomonas hyacinthi]|uniref:ABC transporter n=2 Tax=Xanthomonas hyacinthi TaxID=56455 RepID=A0A2S7ENP2_9XANT|nr:peptidase domain-containing ABC transporter [Xanthomonas hyacinthi]PPU93406.1 hypothetical protein XhyaCFBP1156_20725 [Xanthomonas hyacinthi]QGY77919.1 peptidase domain-containing ABC transporter [Xanthomonas hyacinthi]
MNHLFAGFLKYMRRKPKVPMIYQAEVNECGIACLTMISQAHGSKATLRAMRVRFPPSNYGTSVRDLVELGRSIGYRSTAYRIEPEHLAEIPSPCVALLDLSHFVVIKRIRGGCIFINDPAEGELKMAMGEFGNRFTGVVVAFGPPPEPISQELVERSGVLAFLLAGVASRKLTISAVVAVALILEVLLLLGPLLIQSFTDSVIQAGDVELAYVLMASFAGAALIQLAFGIYRNNLLSRLSEYLVVEWNVRISETLMRLPYSFFLRRASSEVYSRFRSIDVIQRTITNKFVESALDGLGLIFTMAMIFAYSPRLAVVTLIFGAVYACSRHFTFKNARDCEHAEIRETTAQHGILQEMLNGITTIKSGGLESVQLSRYESRTRAAAHAMARLQGWTSAGSTISKFLLQFHTVIIIGFGVLISLRGGMSFGMVIAYVSYSTQFIDRCTRVSDVFVDWRLVKIHNQRLSDILDEKPVVPGATPLPPSDAISIKVESLSYGYGADTESVLRAESFEIGAGECVAVIGRSGVGKSTLIKLMMGLLQPSSGTITFNEVALNEIDPVDLHRSVACVLQDDQLFGGSVFENIASFAPNYSRDEVVAAAIKARIHDEIMAMPMGYETSVINMGKSFSAGQKQRILLARALYGSPKVIFMDEATSHLDVGNEVSIASAIAELNMTRVIVAHRPDTIRSADRVIELHGVNSAEPVS